MKLSVLLVATLVALASMASAAPLCTAVGSTMADYVALGSTGCQIGDKVFYNFFYSSSGGGLGVAVPASAVTLSPVGADTYNPGIAFSSDNWFVPGGSTTRTSVIDSSISFTVTVLPGGHPIDDASLTLGSFDQVGAGTASIGETVLAADGFTQLGFMGVGTNGQLAAEVNFAPTSTIQISKNFALFVPQNGTGSIRVSSFTENFSEIPEPVGAILIGSGLLALGAWRRHGNRG